MPLPDHFIQELLSRNDIETIISSYVNTKRRGRNLVGLCPFHGEKTPSFTVYPETASFYCFGCGAGGDVITFIKRIENLDYIDAVRFLADRCGMKVPELDKNDATSGLRMRILEANREAARLYHQLLYTAEGKEGLDYFHSRGYSDSTIRRFGLGFSPNSYNFLRDELRKKGFKDDELIAAWLAVRGRSNSTNIYDTFRNRVMVPIIDIRGNVIAFGGRVLDDSKPKYLNTADTLAFKKTNNLFALNFAKSNTSKSMILCEGYMDVIALHQAGFTNAVAALGTSFTADHANLLARYTSEAILIFDADAAGQKGAARAIGLLRNTGVHIRVVTIPDGKDPDEFIKKNGPERFKLLLERSANDVEYQLMQIGSRYLLNTANGKTNYITEACNLLATLSSPVERDVYAGKLASDLSVSKDAILNQIQYMIQKRKKTQKNKQLSQIVRKTENTIKKVNPDAGRYPRAVQAEDALIGLLLRNPDYIARTAKKITPEEWLTAFNRRIYEVMLRRFENGQAVEISYLSSEFDEEEMGYIANLVQKAKERANTPEEIDLCIQVVKEENKLVQIGNPTELSAQDMQALLQEMSKRKQ